MESASQFMWPCSIVDVEGCGVAPPLLPELSSCIAGDVMTPSGHRELNHHRTAILVGVPLLGLNASTLRRQAAPL
jgi:hypothetical protein